jgi:hypothetical protein
MGHLPYRFDSAVLIKHGEECAASIWAESPTVKKEHQQYETLSFSFICYLNSWITGMRSQKGTNMHMMFF